MAMMKLVQDSEINSSKLKGKLRECVEKNVLRSPTRKEIYKQYKYKDINQIDEKHKEEI